MQHFLRAMNWDTSPLFGPMIAGSQVENGLSLVADPVGRGQEFHLEEKPVCGEGSPGFP